jgi:OTU domain-containing protein 6
MDKEDEDLTSLQARHKREQKELVAQITSLKKTATKGDKSKRKEVLAGVQVLESHLKERHEREMAIFRTQQADPVYSKDLDEAGGNQVSEADLETVSNVASITLENGNTQNVAVQSSPGGPKMSRQKARLVQPHVSSLPNNVRRDERRKSKDNAK